MTFTLSGLLDWEANIPGKSSLGPEVFTNEMISVYQ